MIWKKLTTKKILAGAALGAMLSGAIFTGCTFGSEFGEDRDSDRVTVSKDVSERERGESGGEHSGERERSESGSEHSDGRERSESGGEHSSRERTEGGGREHGSTGESSGESGSEKTEGSSREHGSTGESGSESGSEKTEGSSREHGSTGESGSESSSEKTEGGDKEHGSTSEIRSESGGEHGSGSESGSESSGESHGAEANEAAMSSPIIPLDQSWNGVLGGLAVSMQYDAATQSVRGTAQNTLTQTLCYVQAEPHLKSGTTTVGELGPEKLGDLNPDEQVTSSLSVADEPNLAGVSYDGYVIHMEVFDCGGAGPVPHTGGEGSESGGGESSGESGSESGGEEGSANMLSPDETFDAVRDGARLILSYDAASNLFEGTVENTTNGVLDRVRIEVHLSNGTELGPTPPIALAPGEVLAIILQSTPDSFDGWIAHAEVGGGESGGEHGSESGGERRGEHGGRGERGGG